MTQDELLSHLRREPFQPFRLHLDDGTQLDVPRSGLVIPGFRSLHVGIPNAAQPDLVDHTVRVEHSKIIRIELLGDPMMKPSQIGQSVTHEQLRSHLRRVPFKPFRLHLEDGQRFDVTNPELMMVTPRTTAVGVPVESGEVIVTFANDRIAHIEAIGDDHG